MSDGPGWRMIRGDPQPCGDSSSASCLPSSCLPLRRQACASPRSSIPGTAPLRRTARTCTGASSGTIRRTTSRRRTTRRAVSTRPRTGSCVAQQMDEIRSAGIDEIVVSWWGRGSAEDQRLPAVIVAARADGIAVAVHLEPYAGRTVASTVADIAVSAQLRHHVVLRLPSVRPGGRRLGCGDERAACRRREALCADRARRRRGERRLRRCLHLRHRHLRRQHVSPPLRSGASRVSCSARRRSGLATTRAAAATIRA